MQWRGRAARWAAPGKSWSMRGGIALLCATTAWGFAGHVTVLAQTAAPASETSGVIRFAIAPQSLDGALTSFGAASGVQVLYDSTITRGRRSPGVSGSLSPRQALERLLAG